jgi:hypothetical protein
MWRTHECAMPLSFPDIGNAAEFVAQPPRSARVLQDPLFAQTESAISCDEQADVDVGRRTGVLPHAACPKPEIGIAHECMRHIPKR